MIADTTYRLNDICDGVIHRFLPILPRRFNLAAVMTDSAPMPRDESLQEEFFPTSAAMLHRRFPWLRLLRAFRMAIGLRPMLLALLAVIVWSAGEPPAARRSRASRSRMRNGCAKPYFRLHQTSFSQA